MTAVASRSSRSSGPAEKRRLVASLCTAVKFGGELGPQGAAQPQAGFRPHDALDSRLSSGDRERHAGNERTRARDPRPSSDVLDPVRMSFDRLAVTGQIEARTVLPAGIERHRHASRPVGHLSKASGASVRCPMAAPSLACGDNHRIRSVSHTRSRLPPRRQRPHRATRHRRSATGAAPTLRKLPLARCRRKTASSGNRHDHGQPSTRFRGTRSKSTAHFSRRSAFRRGRHGRAAWSCPGSEGRAQPRRGAKGRMPGVPPSDGRARWWRPE